MLSLSADQREGVLRFGSQALAAFYPEELRVWFERRLEKNGFDGELPRIEICGEAPDRFELVVGGDRIAQDLTVGNVLGQFWEHAGRQLVERLTSAFAVHCAAVLLGRTLVVIPGSSGAGKSQLALWFLTKGARLLTDEVASFRADVSEPGIELAGALRRPVFLKGLTDASSLMGDSPVPSQVNSNFGLLVDLDGGGERPEYDNVVFVFPRFVAGTDLTIAPLTAGETAHRLMGNCINVRNLARGGLADAAQISLRANSVSLEYGATSQIDGILDSLAAAAVRLEPEELAAICRAISSRSEPPVTLTSTAAPESRPVPPATTKRFSRRLTVGMATYDDYDGAYFTIQALRLANADLMDEIEFIVVDNNPGGACSAALAELENWVSGYRYLPVAARGTAVRNAVFEEASSPVVLCLDSHVLVERQGIPALLAHFDANPGSLDLVQGPLVYDDLREISTHWEPKWRGGMFGTWATDPRGTEPTAPAFEVPMLGLGLFACRRDAWPGFSPAFRGFGGEEGYIHEKVRRRGGRTLCLPALRWVHRFARPSGVPYANRWEDRIRNYIIGFTELGWDTAPIVEHFSTILGSAKVHQIVSGIEAELAATELPA